MRGSEEHGGRQPQHLPDVSVDHAAVAGDDDVLTVVAGDDALDEVHASVAELLLGFGIGVHIPRAMADETLTRPGEA